MPTNNAPPRPTTPPPVQPPTVAAAQANANTQVKGFLDTEGLPESIKDAGQDVKDGIQHLANAAEAFQSGDVMGGTAMVMRGIGSLSAMLAFVAPPFGAIAAAVLGAITELIAAILEAMRPETESLEQKLKRLIETESLSEAYVAMSAGKAEWELAETKIYMLAAQRKRATERLKEDDAKPSLSKFEREELEAIRAGWTWEYLTQNIRWERHKGRISMAFAELAKKRDLASTEWMALYDITVTYAVRFWTAFESMAGLVRDPQYTRDAASLDNVELFQALRRVVARQLREDLLSVHFEAQNNCQIFHLNIGVQDHQPIGQRIGVAGQTVGRTDWLGDKSSAFAVSSGGTIFSSGTVAGGEPVYVGRGKGGWKKAEGTPNCDQIFICEVYEPGKLGVISLHGYGQKLSYANFDDREGVGEDSVRDWSPNKHRWGAWTERSVESQKLTILTLGMYPVKGGYGVHLLGYHQDRKDVRLYDLYYEPFRLETPQRPIVFSAEEVKRELGSDLWRRSKPSRCTVSYLRSGEAVVQLGGLGRGWDAGSPFTWDLRAPGFLDDSNVRIDQGRFYPDGSLVCAAEKALYMRCQPEGPLGPSVWVKDATIQTSCFWKQCSTQAAGAIELYGQLQAVSSP